jgi:hypothetical protein
MIHIQDVYKTTMVARAPNQALQRAGTHKVLGRGRSGRLLEQVMRARVLMRWRAVAELCS